MLRVVCVVCAVSVACGMLYAVRSVLCVVVCWLLLAVVWCTMFVVCC